MQADMQNLRSGKKTGTFCYRRELQQGTGKGCTEFL